MSMNILEENARLLEYKYDVKVKDMMSLVREKEEWSKTASEVEPLKCTIQSQEETIEKLRSKIETLSLIVENNKADDNEAAAKQDSLPQEAKSLISSTDAGTSPMKAALSVGDMDKIFISAR